MLSTDLLKEISKRENISFQIQIWKKKIRRRESTHKNWNIWVIFPQSDIFSKSTTPLLASSFYILWYFIAIYFSCLMLNIGFHVLTNEKVVRFHHWYYSILIVCIGLTCSEAQRYWATASSSIKDSTFLFRKELVSKYFLVLCMCLFKETFSLFPFPYMPLLLTNLRESIALINFCLYCCKTYIL